MTLVKNDDVILDSLADASRRWLGEEQRSFLTAAGIGPEDGGQNGQVLLGGVDPSLTTTPAKTAKTDVFPAVTSP